MLAVIFGLALLGVQSLNAAAWETATNVATDANAAFDTVAPAAVGVTGFIIILGWVKKLLKRAG